jgi:ketosteroid isomerase-like protein
MSKTQNWVDGYIRAWKSKDPADLVALFTEDGEYWFRPEDPEPLRGLAEIQRMWVESEEPSEPSYEFEVLVEDEKVGVAKGWVDYPGHQHYANIWEIHFADDGRATRFVEWFMTPRKAQ